MFQASLFIEEQYGPGDAVQFGSSAAQMGVQVGVNINLHI